MMEMDEKTKARYKAWKQRKILKLMVLGMLLLLVVVGGLFFGLRSCNHDEYPETILNINPDDSTEETEETEEPTEEYEPEPRLPEIRIQFA